MLAFPLQVLLVDRQVSSMYGVGKEGDNGKEVRGNKRMLGNRSVAVLTDVNDLHPRVAEGGGFSQG